MSPMKLTTEDKQEIVRLYRDPQETTTTLAARFQVSSSTISRLLKSAFSAEEYGTLIQQKRNRGAAARGSAPAEDPAEPETAIAPSEPPATDDGDAPARSGASPNSPTVVRDERPQPNDPEPSDAVAEAEAIGDGNGEGPSWLDNAPDSDDDDAEDDDEDFASPMASIWGEDCDGLEDDDDWDEDADEEDASASITPVEEEAIAETDVEILPLSAANFPRTCYLVVDRAGELVVKPLKEFRDLGRLPDTEFQCKTLVVFDNHKVARRFSNNRTQRVVKIPDGRLLHKTSVHLHGKGISRILMDGRVYALTVPSSAEE